MSRVDTDSDHAEYVSTRKSTIAVESWMQSTRSLSVAESEFDAEVKGALIVLRAKSMMMIDLRNVGQCVIGTQKISQKCRPGGECATCVVDSRMCEN